MFGKTSKSDQDFNSKKEREEPAFVECLYCGKYCRIHSGGKEGVFVCRECQQIF